METKNTLFEWERKRRHPALKELPKKNGRCLNNFLQNVKKNTKLTLVYSKLFDTLSSFQQDRKRK